MDQNKMGKLIFVLFSLLNGTAIFSFDMVSACTEYIYQQAITDTAVNSTFATVTTITHFTFLRYYIFSDYNRLYFGHC